MLIFGYQLRIFECKLNEVSEQNFSNMINSIWNMIITLTSVGYGDIFPKTNCGRIVGILICFWGFFIVSFFVLTVDTILQFHPNEKSSYDTLQSLSLKMEMKKNAIAVLSAGNSLKRLKQSKNPQINTKQAKISKFQTFRSAMLEFSQIARQVRLHQDDCMPDDTMSNFLEDMI